MLHKKMWLKPTGKDGGFLGSKASVPTKAFQDKMAAEDFKTKANEGAVFNSE